MFSILLSSGGCSVTEHADVFPQVEDAMQTHNGTGNPQDTAYLPR